MEVVPLAIEGVKLIRPRRHADARGYMVETWNRRAFAAAGIDVDFVQDNVSLSTRAGTVRGLHFQRPPHAQAKLVRVLRGEILDVALDIRQPSPTFGRHVAVRLSAGTGEQLFVPTGFAHGFCTLSPETEVAYKLTDYYAPEHSGGILWNDSALAIAWPLDGAQPLLSDRDRELPSLADAQTGF